MKWFKAPITYVHLAGWLLFLTFPLLFINNEQLGFSSLILLKSPFYWIFFATYLILFYLNTQFLIPQFIFKKKYISYGIAIATLFAIVCLAQPYNKLISHNSQSISGFQQENNGLNRSLLNKANVGPKIALPFGPLPNQDLRMQDPNLKVDRIQSDTHFLSQIDMVSLFIFMMIIGISLATSTVSRWQTTEQKVAKAESDKASAELSFLKAQINPHFLFNTLNNIYTLSIINSEHTAASIMKLSNIMRYVTDDVTNNLVSLSDEIDCIRDYIELQKIRLSADDEVIFEVNGELTTQKIAPLILMTFIENAFKYGLTKKEKTVIRIQLNIEDEKIAFFCQNQIHRIPKDRERTGIGIENTKQRLQFLYPAKHELQIENLNQTFTVNLTIAC